MLPAGEELSSLASARLDPHSLSRVPCIRDVAQSLPGAIGRRRFGTARGCPPLFGRSWCGAHRLRRSSLARQPGTCCHEGPCDVRRDRAGRLDGCDRRRSRLALVDPFRSHQGAPEVASRRRWPGSDHPGVRDCDQVPVLRAETVECAAGRGGAALGVGHGGQAPAVAVGLAVTRSWRTERRGRTVGHQANSRLRILGIAGAGRGARAARRRARRRVLRRGCTRRARSRGR
jgi:hypothetical protein